MTSLAADDLRSSPRARNSATGSTFAVLWAGAHVVHVWQKGGPSLVTSVHGLLMIVVLGLALSIIVRPRSVHALALLALAQVVAFAAEFPFVANHWTLAAFVNAGIVVAYVPMLRACDHEPVDLVPRFAAHARLVFLISYTAAALAKLNTTFLHPEHSCALTTVRPLTTAVGLGSLESGTAPVVVIWSVVLIELAVPFLLLVRTSRKLGIGLACVFHLVLAAAPTIVVMDYTLFVIALCFLFVPADLGDRLVEDARRTAERRPRGAAIARRTATPLRAVGVAGAAFFVLERGELIGFATWATITWAVFLLVGAVMVTVVISMLLINRPSGTDKLLGAGRRPTVPHLMLLLVLVANVASPYVGLKTTSSFTMFSNLRTEAGVTNHLFVPSVPLFGYQHDVVEIVGSSNEALQRRAEDGQLIAFVELRRELLSDPSASVEYIRRGERSVIDVAAEHAEFTSMPYWEHKLLRFRPIAADGVPRCQA